MLVKDFLALYMFLSEWNSEPNFLGGMQIKLTTAKQNTTYS